jgi:hypothetical protein
MEYLKKKYIRWSEDCVWQPMGTILVILKTSESGPSTEDKSPSVTLNETGRAIWELCDGTKTFDVIVGHLLKEYKGDPEQIRKSVEETISALKEQGFLTYEETPKKYGILNVPFQKYPIWHDNVIWNEEKGHIVAMNNQTGRVFPVPDEAADMWKLCDGKKTVNEILSVLKEKGAINEEMSAYKFKLLFKQLIKLELLSLKDELV